MCVSTFRLLQDALISNSLLSRRCIMAQATLDAICNELEASQPSIPAAEGYHQQDWKGELTFRRVFGPLSIGKVKPYTLVASLVTHPVDNEGAMRHRCKQVRIRNLHRHYEGLLH